MSEINNNTDNELSTGLTNVRTYKKTCRLRWYSPTCLHSIVGEKVLQQECICLETGEYEWEDVPCVECNEY